MSATVAIALSVALRRHSISLEAYGALVAIDENHQVGKVPLTTDTLATELGISREKAGLITGRLRLQGLIWFASRGQLCPTPDGDTVIESLREVAP